MTKTLEAISGTSQPQSSEPDVIDLNQVENLTPRDRAARIEEIRLKCEEKIANFFSVGLDEVLTGYKNLALNAEDENVKERASRKILDTFRKAQAPVLPQTPIFIQNNNLVPEMSVMNGKQSEIIETGPVKVALNGFRSSKAPKLIEPEPQDPSKKAQFQGKLADVPVKASEIKNLQKIEGSGAEDSWQTKLSVKIPR